MEMFPDMMLLFRGSSGCELHARSHRAYQNDIKGRKTLSYHVPLLRDLISSICRRLATNGLGTHLLQAASQFSSDPKVLRMLALLRLANINSSVSCSDSSNEVGYPPETSRYS
jgi:hypothetical protein